MNLPQEHFPGKKEWNQGSGAIELEGDTGGVVTGLKSEELDGRDAVKVIRIGN